MVFSLIRNTGWMQEQDQHTECRKFSNLQGKKEGILLRAFIIQFCSNIYFAVYFYYITQSIM